MAYRVTEKYEPHAEQTRPGEHYTVENPSEKNWWFRTISFYRSPHGREVALDGIQHVLANDGDIFRSVKVAVEAYDAKEASMTPVTVMLCDG